MPPIPVEGTLVVLAVVALIVLVIYGLRRLIGWLRGR